MTARYQGIEYDVNNAIVPGAKIYVLDRTGANLQMLTDDLGNNLPNPVISNNLGVFYFNVATPDTYFLRHFYNGREQLDEFVNVGEGGGGTDPWLRADLASTAPGKGIELIGRARQPISATRTYYVRTDGSDSNNGLSNSAAGAFLTIQKAIDTVYNTLDLNGQVVIIQVADGSYTTPIVVRGPTPVAPGGQPFRIIGNEATPANVVISVTNNNAVTLENGAYLLLAGVTVSTTTSGAGWSVSSNSMLEHRNCQFGNVAADMIITQHHATVRALGPTTVAGNAVTFCHATKRSVIDFASQTLTYVGNPTFSTYLFGLNDASVNLDSATIVGAATGRILVHDASILNISSLTGNPLGGFAYEVEDGGYIANPDLMTARTLYVRTDGNDANDGFSDTAARAFKTIQAAIDTLAKLPYDPKGFAPGGGWVIKIADGSYAQTVNFRDVVYPNVIVRGNLTTPANVVIAGVNDGVVALGIRTKYFIEGVKLQAASGSGIRAEQGAIVSINNVVFGVCSAAHVYSITGAQVVADGNYSIAGAASYHALTRLSAAIDFQGITLTITGTPAFSGSFAYCEQGASIRASGMTFVGSATGKRYEVNYNGSINVGSGGTTYLPGNTAGTTSSGGQYTGVITSVDQGGTGSTSPAAARAALGVAVSKADNRAPYPTDDTTAGYATGDLWGVKDGTQYMCSTPQAGKAVWAVNDLSNMPMGKQLLPLDRITGASLAIAPFKLRAAYAGNCFQVQRDSDNTTLDVGFVWDSVRKVYVADWEACDKFINDGSANAWYTKIYDQSGNGYDLTATTFKVYIINGSIGSTTRNDINGLRTFTFWGGTRTEMAIPVTHSVSRQNCTVISAGCVSASGHGNAFCELGNDASYLNRLLLTTIVRDGRLQPIGNANLVGTRIESSPHVVGAGFGSGVSDYMCNDDTATAGGLTAQTLTGGFLGSANGGGYTYWGDYGAFIVYPTKRTTAEMQILRQMLSRVLRLSPQSRDRLICAGDSITVGADASAQPWWRQILPILDRNFKVFNNALEGDTASSATGSVAAQVTSSVKAGVTNVVVYAYGTNDLAALSATNGDAANATTVQTRIQSHCQAIKTANPTVKIVVCTILPRNNSFTGGQTNTSFEASRLLINAWIRANYTTFADALADYGGDAYIGQYANVSDGTWMNGNLHPKARGHAWMGAYVASAVNGLG